MLIDVNLAKLAPANRRAVFWLIILALFCLLWLAFSIRTASNWMAFPQFLVSVVVMFVLPGHMLLRWWRLSLTTVEALAVATCLGMVVTCTLYGTLALLGAPRLIWAWFLIALWQARPVVQQYRISAACPRLEHVLLLLVLAAVSLPILLISFYWRNLSVTPSGGMTFYPFVPDIPLHTAVAGELTHTMPPQVPYLSGLPLSYHIGMDVVTAVLARFGGLSIADLVSRFCPLLFVNAAVLAIFCFGRRFMKSGKAGVALAFLTVMGGDLSFVPGLLQLNRGTWDVYYYQISTIFSFYYVNPMAMGLATLFVGLFCLHHSLTDARPGWKMVAGLCIVALIEIKIFLFIMLGLSILMVAIRDLAMFKSATFLRFGLFLLLLSLPFGLYILQTNAGGGNNVWIFSPGLDTYVKTSAERVGLSAIGAYLVLSLPLYLLGTFGFRIFGAAEMLRALKPSRENSFACMLAVFIILGPLLTLTTKIVPRADPAGYDNAAWFFCAAKFVAPIFAVIGLSRFWAGGGRRRHLAMIALLAAISLPTTLEYLAKNTISKSPPRWDAAEITAIQALNRVAAPGQVVLPAMAGMDALVMTNTRLRLPFAEAMFISTVVDPGLAAVRKRDVDAFRQSWARGTFDAGIVARYSVNWIVAPHRASLSIASADRLEPVFDNDAFTIYRVRQTVAPLGRSDRAS